MALTLAPSGPPGPVVSDDNAVPARLAVRRFRTTLSP